MILKQRKSTEVAGKKMAENKNTLSWKFYLAELIMVLAGTMGMWLVGLAKELPTDRLLGNCVSFLLCFPVVKSRKIPYN